MKISVAIAAYNAAEYLREAIASVLAQTLQPFEIIVVDDGSTDHTRQVCESFGERITYFYQPNDGTAGIGARWKSINEARCDWIALLDHDDRWLPNKLQLQSEALATFPDCALVFTRYRNIDELGRPLDQSSLPPAAGHTKRFDCHDALHHLLHSNPYCPSSALILRRALIEDGPPSETSCGDWSDWFRITRKYPMAVRDEYLTEYRMTAEQFCANKDHLATRMQECLISQKPLLHVDCDACQEAFRAGEAHVKQIFSVAARDYLDRYHEAARAGDPARALLLLRQAMRAAPMEVLRPRRFIAASKNYLLARIRRKNDTE